MNISSIRWLNFLSLDVIFLALFWQEVLARSTHTYPTLQERTLLGLVVGMIYIFDHLLDARVNKSLPHLNNAPRHHFIKKHALLFRYILLFATLIALSLLSTISYKLLLSGSLLALLTLLYLGMNTFLLNRGDWFSGREVFIAFIFTVGCGLAPLLHLQGRADKILLAFSLIEFFILAFLNCTLIARLERGVHDEQLFKHLTPLPILSFLISLLFLFFAHHNIDPASMKSITIMSIGFFVSILGLLSLGKIGQHYGDEVASLAADGALIAGGLSSLLLFSL